MANPITDFLKLASPVRVKAHLRTAEGKTTLVDAHERTKKPSTKRNYTPLTEEQLRLRQAKEVELWQAWKDSGESVAALRPLLKSFGPMIRSKVNVYRGRVKLIPDSAIETEFQLRFVDALRSYDPVKGALGTYVYKYLDKAKRFIVENQNIGRIPENRVYKIRQFTNVRDELTEDLGREPTIKELGSRLKWAEAEVERMDSELRGDLVTQGFEEDPFALAPSKSEEILRLFKYELTGHERDVYEYLTGYGRPHTPSTSAIAKKMKIEDYQVSRIKQSIQKKLKRYLND